MRIRLPSVDTLKAEKCPAALALMMHEMYALLPDVQLNADGKRDSKQEKYLERLARRLSKVRTFDDFKKVGELLLRGVPDSFDEDKPLKEQFTRDVLNTPQGVSKYRKLVDWLGLELPNWGDEDFLKYKYVNARVQTGESAEKVQWELMQEEEAKELAAGKKPRKMSDEDREKEEEQKRIMSMYLHDTPEAWHTVKRMARKLANVAKEEITDEEWSAFEKEEEAFVSRFGLKGLRFPYAMGLKSRKEGLADVTSNLEKVAKALDMPDSYVGFRGRMPVYYGGAVSGSLGTYTYLTHTLYLLKDMGDRATAHEWFHALDYDLAYQTGNAAMNSLGGAPSFSEPHLVAAFGDMKKVQHAMIALLDGVNHGFNGGKPVDADAFTDSKGIFWQTIQGVYAKELFRWVPEENRANSIQRFNYACKQFHTKEMTPDQFTRYVGTEYENALALAMPETKDLMLTSFKDEVRILSGLYRELKDNPQYFDGERASFMKWFAEQLDTKAGKEYYTIPTELIARMGEQYVFDRLESPLREHKTPQYALGFEKDKIQERFSAWVNEAKMFLAHDMNAVARPKAKISA
jgi:hypothetical protein